MKIHLLIIQSHFIMNIGITFMTNAIRIYVMCKTDYNAPFLNANCYQYCAIQNNLYTQSITTVEPNSILLTLLH